MLKELPDKQKYYEMALTDLRDASNAATLAWTRAVIDERNRRSQELGEAATQKDREDIVNDLLKNATPAIMDLISIATWIEDIYRERLEKATEEILSRRTQKAKIDGLIDLLGMKLMKPGQPQPNQVTIGIEKFGEETITFAPGTLNLSEAGEEFFRKNWNAIVNKLKRREEAEEAAAREATAAKFLDIGRSKPITALQHIHRAEQDPNKEIPIGRLEYSGVEIIVGDITRENASPGRYPRESFENLIPKLNPSIQLAIVYLLTKISEAGKNKRVIVLSVPLFAKWRDISEREARIQLSALASVIGSSSINLPVKYAEDLDIIPSIASRIKWADRAGRFRMYINTEFGKMYFAKKPIPISKEIGKIDTNNNPYSPSIYLWLCSYYAMNKADDGFKCKIGMDSILKACQLNGLPTHKEVKESGRAYARRIINPVKRDLKHLEDRNMITWAWTKAGANAEITEEPKDYAAFRESFGIFSFPDYPDQTKRINRIEGDRTKKAELKRIKEEKAEALSKQ